MLLFPHHFAMGNSLPSTLSTVPVVPWVLTLQFEEYMAEYSQHRHKSNQATSRWKMKASLFSKGVSIGE